MSLKNTFCTITTASHITETLALYHSIYQFNKTVPVNVLITDSEKVEWSGQYNNLKYYSLQDIVTDSLSKKLQEQYKDQSDELRWSMKPVFLKYLLEQEGYDAVIYNDNDLFYFNDFNFLFEALQENHVLLSPHWRIADPEVDKDWFETNFKDGLYNAGFIGVNKKAVDAMKWWAKSCLYACVKNPARGLWDDQRYLDMMPVLFKKVKLLEHQGCNVAYWNQHECKRVEVGDKVMINSQWPVVFIHFTQELMDAIRQDHDPLLKPHLESYLSIIKKFKRAVKADA